MIPWQSPNSSREGILQESRHPPGWGRMWGTPEGGWWRVNWLEGQSLEDFLQQWVAAVAHLEGPLVRPRWQREPANIPDFNTPCWGSVGVTRYLPLNLYSYVEHHSAGDGHDEMTRWEELTVECTFYGPDAGEVTGRFHSNLMIRQNTHLLRRVGMAFVEAGEHRRVPEFIKEQWLDRYDKTLTIRRSVWRAYPVLSFLDFQGWVRPDGRYDYLRYRAPFGTHGRPFDAPRDGILYGRRQRQWEPVLPVAGGTMEGQLELAREPQEPEEASTQRYVNIHDAGKY
ncbi:MAG: hypothetical protein J2P48_11700 [Alphaproteobacteria bacterium]|nr:hypothetical protein [Alphaproteobacteria bacterium]